MMINLEHIYKNNDKFVIQREFNGKNYYFGEFDTLDDAIDKRNSIDADGWPIPIEFDGNIKEKTKTNFVDVSFKVGSSYKHGFLVLTRDETKNLIPELPYETSCDVILDNISAKIKLNVLLRLVITKGNDELREYLKHLSEVDSNQRKNIRIILNKEEENPISKI